MNVFILEGINDVIFFETLLKLHFKKSNIPKAHGIQFRKGIDKVRRILLGRNYNYIKTNVDLMIYGDNGRPNIINKALPRLVEDTIGRIPDVLKFFTVLDADRFSDEETLDLIENKLKEKNIPFSEIKKYKNLLLKKVKPEEVTEEKVESVLKEWERRPEFAASVIDPEKRRLWKKKIREQLSSA